VARSFFGDAVSRLTHPSLQPVQCAAGTLATTALAAMEFTQVIDS